MKPIVFLNRTPRIQSLIGIWGCILLFTLIVTSVRWLSPEQSPLLRVQVQRGMSTMDSAAVELGTEISAATHSGEGTYQLHCASCHGMPGVERVAGLTGSDLFDGVSERPVTRESMVQILREGILDKGMLPMAVMFDEYEMEALVDFLLVQQPG